MLDVTIEHDVPATMRDGVVLRADVYRPTTRGPWPVLLTRLPYGKNLPLFVALLDPVGAARRGFIVVVQDTRGRFASDGEWEPWMFGADDGLRPALQQIAHDEARPSRIVLPVIAAPTGVAM